MLPPFMQSQAASDHLKNHWGLRASKKTLDKLASVGGGPEFHKAGHARLYTPEALDAYARSIIGPAQTSTAQNEVKERKRPGARPRGRPRKLPAITGIGESA